MLFAVSPVLGRSRIAVVSRDVPKIPTSCQGQGVELREWLPLTFRRCANALNLVFAPRLPLSELCFGLSFGRARRHSQDRLPPNAVEPFIFDARVCRDALASNPLSSLATFQGDHPEGHLYALLYFRASKMVRLFNYLLWQRDNLRPLVQLGGLEPPTSCSTDRRSNQLSYNCILGRPEKGVPNGAETRCNASLWQGLITAHQRRPRADGTHNPWYSLRRAAVATRPLTHP